MKGVELKGRFSAICAKSGTDVLYEHGNDNARRAFSYDDTSKPGLDPESYEIA